MEPISFKQICVQLEVEEKNLNHWILIAVDGNRTVVERLCAGQVGCSVPDLHHDLNFICDIFSEWPDEALLETLIKASVLLQADLETFLFEGWRFVLDKDDVEMLVPEFLEIDSTWKWAGIEGKPPFSDLEAFAKAHSKQVVTVDDAFVFRG